MAGAVLLRDQHDRERLEPQRHVEPPEPEVIAVRRPSAGLTLTDRPDAPRSIAAADPLIVRHRDVRTIDVQHTAPRAELREPPGVEDEPPPLSQLVALLIDRGKRTRPGQVEPDRSVTRLAHQPNPLQWLDHLDAERTDRGMKPVVVDLVGGANHPLLVTPAHSGVRVLHTQVRVVAETGDQERPAVAVVRVEVATVIEVAVARADERQRLRRLM